MLILDLLMLILLCRIQGQTFLSVPKLQAAKIAKSVPNPMPKSTPKPNVPNSNKRQSTSVTSERGYNPETPSNFQNNPKATPLDDTPTEAGIGGACHLVKLPWLHPVTDTKKQ